MSYLLDLISNRQNIIMTDANKRSLEDLVVFKKEALRLQFNLLKLWGLLFLISLDMHLLDECIPSSPSHLPSRPRAHCCLPPSQARTAVLLSRTVLTYPDSHRPRVLPWLPSLSHL